MIKEALQYIVGLGKAEEHMINGACYSDKPLHRIDTYYPKADAIEMHTLTSLVDYIKWKKDERTNTYLEEPVPFFDDAMAMLRYSIEEERKAKPRLNRKVKGGI